MYSAAPMVFFRLRNFLGEFQHSPCAPGTYAAVPEYTSNSWIWLIWSSQNLMRSSESLLLIHSGVVVVTISCKVPFFWFNFHVVILALCHITTTIDLSASPASLSSLMNSTNIRFTTEFMQTMLTKRQTSPPCCSARHPLNHVVQVQGGQVASQHASPAALPVEPPHTTVALPSSTCFTRSSLKAVATTLPKAVEPGGYIDVLVSIKEDVPDLPDSPGALNKEGVPDSAEANSTFGGLTLPPELPAHQRCLLHW